jgi:hypothetical protein
MDLVAAVLAASTAQSPFTASHVPTTTQEGNRRSNPAPAYSAQASSSSPRDPGAPPKHNRWGGVVAHPALDLTERPNIENNRGFAASALKAARLAISARLVLTASVFVTGLIGIW